MANSGDDPREPPADTSTTAVPGESSTGTNSTGAVPAAGPSPADDAATLPETGSRRRHADPASEPLDASESVAPDRSPGAQTGEVERRHDGGPDDPSTSAGDSAAKGEF
jgi:hypothetical protein